MNFFRKMYCRVYQKCFKLILPFLPYREPKILEDMDKVVGVLTENKIQKIFLATDKSIRKLGLTKELEDKLSIAEIEFVVFDDILPNPTIKMVEEGVNIYHQNNCQAAIAFGGGSVMDCTKAVLARIVRPKKSISQMKGLLKIRKKLPLLFAVPTTAGTGSETTVAAVITDDKTHHKYAINDFSLIPHYAVLDYKTTLGLPKHITASTGMDALTHAVEAYIGQTTTKRTRQMSEEAVKLVFENLIIAFDEPQSVIARQNMLKAAYCAGYAFTVSYVGYVHAIAHSLGGKYGTAHGLANSIILPVVLKSYGKNVYKKLAKLSRLAGIADENDSDEFGCEKFIAKIEEMNKYFGFKPFFEELKESDIDDLAGKADKEANPLYPVPKLFDKKELEEIYRRLLKPKD